MARQSLRLRNLPPDDTVYSTTAPVAFAGTTTSFKSKKQLLDNFSLTSNAAKIKRKTTLALNERPDDFKGRKVACFIKESSTWEEGTLRDATNVRKKKWTVEFPSGEVKMVSSEVTKLLHLNHILKSTIPKDQTGAVVVKKFKDGFYRKGSVTRFNHDDTAAIEFDNGETQDLNAMDLLGLRFNLEAELPQTYATGTAAAANSDRESNSGVAAAAHIESDSDSGAKDKDSKPAAKPKNPPLGSSGRHTLAVSSGRVGSGNASSGGLKNDFDMTDTAFEQAFIYGKDEEHNLSTYPASNLNVQRALLDDLKNATSDLGVFKLAENQQSDKMASSVPVRVRFYIRIREGSQKFLSDEHMNVYLDLVAPRNPSNLHCYCFSPSLYTQLVESGVEQVAGQTKRRNIDIFKITFLGVPVHGVAHWSMFVVVNAGCVKKKGDEDGHCCILQLDSLLTGHDMDETARHIRDWLNSQWQKKHNDGTSPFTEESAPVYRPQVPRQRDSFNCGVYACRYAYAIYRMKGVRLSNREMKENHGACLERLITNHELFSFGSNDITEMRRHMKTWVKRVANVMANSDIVKKVEAQASTDDDSVEVIDDAPRVGGGISRAELPDEGPNTSDTPTMAVESSEEPTTPKRSASDTCYQEAGTQESKRRRVE